MPWVVVQDERLAGEDAAWLHMDRPSNPMVITALLELDGVLGLPEIHAILERRLLRFDRFRQRVVEPHLGGAPSWRLDPDFQLARHVVRHRLDSRADAELRAAIDRVVSTPLDRGHPPWELHVFERPEGGTLLLARIHHAIADGFALLGVLLSLCDDAAPEPEARTPTRWSTRLRAAAAEVGARVVQPQRLLRDAALGGRWLRSAARLLLLLPDRASPLRGPLGPRKSVAWSRAFALDPIRAAAHRSGATINDVLVAALAGGLRRYLARSGAAVHDVRAMIPVNLRDLRASVGLGNRFGLVVLSLPLSVAAPSARLHEVKRRMDALKRSAEAQVGMAIVAAMGLAPRGLESLGVRFFSAKASAVLTNVPGPRAAVRIGGRTVSRMLFWVPQSGDLALGLSIFSYAGAVTLGVMADAGRVPEPARLVADIEEALELAIEGSA